MAYVMKTGTVTDSQEISTGLSSIQQFILYRKSMTSSGLLIGHYNSELGTHYSYCTSYSTYTKYVAHGNDAPTINGGTITWLGTIGSTTYALASGVEYTWIAFGEE